MVLHNKAPDNESAQDRLERMSSHPGNTPKTVFYSSRLGNPPSSTQNVVPPSPLPPFTNLPTTEAAAAAAAAIDIQMWQKN